MAAIRGLSLGIQMSNETLTLAELLRSARIEAGLLQSDLSRITGIQPSVLSELETGRILSPRPATLVRVFHGLGLDREADDLARLFGLEVSSMAYGEA
jgi:transcriptional regulator with XRE-family HTH domain